MRIPVAAIGDLAKSTAFKTPVNNRCCLIDSFENYPGRRRASTDVVNGHPVRFAARRAGVRTSGRFPSMTPVAFRRQIAGPAGDLEKC
jgi:hypothetical protein